MWVLGFSSSEVVLAGWAAILERDKGFPFARYCPEAVAPASVDEMVLVDLCSDPSVALQFLQELVNQRRDIKLVIWGRGVNTLHQLRLSLGCQIHGCLPRTCTVQEFLDCLNAVSRGDVWLPEVLTSPSVSTFRLTRRERQVARLAITGMKNREIAADLGIRPGTVKVHLKHVFEQVGVRNRVALVVWASRHPGEI